MHPEDTVGPVHMAFARYVDSVKIDTPHCSPKRARPAGRRIAVRLKLPQVRGKTLFVPVAGFCTTADFDNQSSCTPSEAHLGRDTDAPSVYMWRTFPGSSPHTHSSSAQRIFTEVSAID
ncbi:hypothetical protein DPSP01_007626 [Paraphaeosphaeria sporulosa]